MPSLGYGRTMAVALADVDGDNDLDIVAGRLYRNINSSYDAGLQNLLLTNNGTGTFTDVTATHMPSDSEPTHALALGDVDGDGDLDLVVGNESGMVPAPSRIYLNNGSGRFAGSAGTQLPSQGMDITVLGDVDRDDDLDLVFDNDGPSNRLYFNLQRQLHAPVDLRIGTTYSLDVYLRNGPPSRNDFALPYVSFAPASIPLPGWGTLGIDPAQAVALPVIQIPQPAGVGSLRLPVANDPRLVGLKIYVQALLVPQPFQARLSNAVRDVVVR